MTLKRCPSCNHAFNVEPLTASTTCPKCEAKLCIHKVLSDSNAAKGGFKLLIIDNTQRQQLSTDDILAYIHRKGPSYANEIAWHYKRSESSIRSYIRMMVSEGVVKRRRTDGRIIVA